MFRVLLIVVFAFLAFGCNKSGGKHPCFSTSKLHNNACPANCPGFIACDGQTYCNECEAYRKQ